MSSLQIVKNMYDFSLKPRMLRTLIKEDLPDEKKPFDTPSRLSRIVSTVQTHRLLSENFDSAAADPKLVQRWKSAVDDWVDRVLSLVSNSYVPDKYWAGISLLGVTCQECSSERFLVSYAVWFDKLLSHIQSPSDSQFVKVASCTSMSDLITRLALFPTEKKDATSLAGKVSQPLLRFLKEDNSETAWEGAIRLLCTIITSFPASLHRYYDNVEAAITSKILLGSFSVNLREELAHCLALLPRSKGDEGSWLLTMQKILLLVNGSLNEIFHGLEEDTKWSEAVRLLLPPGEDPPSVIWGQKFLEETSDKAKKRSKLCSVSTLMRSCCKMLTSSYPVQVAVPLRSLLALVERVLMVDGTVPRTALPFVLAFEQEFTCTELPMLHLYSLELLSSVMRGVHSQILPHAAYVVRFVKEYFKRCELPELRVKVYSITKTLLISMGVGTAIYLAQEVVDNSLRDLNSIHDDRFPSEASPETLQQTGVPGRRKRKIDSSETLVPPALHGSRKRKLGATGSLRQCEYNVGSDVVAQKIHLKTPIPLKIAALEAIEALLTVGGALRSESWRSKVDHLLITTATNSFKQGWSDEEWNTSLFSGSTLMHSDLQLAALRALLASVLSPSPVRPPHLARAFELFRTGRQEAGARISEFCMFALLSLEALIHPRALPLAPFSSGMREIGHSVSDSDDDVYITDLDSSKETEAPAAVPHYTANDLNPPEIFRLQQEDKVPMPESSGAKDLGTNEQRLAAATLDIGRRDDGDEVMAELMQLQEPRLHPQEPGPSKDATISTVASDPPANSMEFTSVNTDAGASGSAHQFIASDERSLQDQKDELIFQRDTVIAVDTDHDSDGDSIPDIVDVDPDSD